MGWDNLGKVKQLEDQGITEELLRHLYLDNKLSVRNITEYLGIPCRYLLRYFKIPMRTKSEANRTRSISEEMKRKISIAAYKRYRERPELKERQSLIMKEKIANGWEPSTEAAHAETRRLWKDPEYKEARLRKMKLPSRPNKKELYLWEVINVACPGEYEYFGKGGFVIGSFIPDFVNYAKNKVIEHFGDYWHSPETVQCNGLKMEPGRIDEYSYLGWDCLVIWEHELKYSKKWLIHKIQSFNEREFTKKDRPEVVVLTLTKEEMSHSDFGIGRELLLNESIEFSGSLL